MADHDRPVSGIDGCHDRVELVALAVLAALDTVSKALGATPAQVALAWQMARPSITAPIASATSVAQLQDLMRAAQLKLDEQSIALLNASSA